MCDSLLGIFFYANNFLIHKAMTEIKLKKQKSLMQELNYTDLVKAVFPYDKHWEIKIARFVKKGIAEWPTWFIVIYRGKVFDDYILLTICGHADETRCEYFKDDADIELFDNELQKAVANDSVFLFSRNHEQLGNNKILTPLESFRLVNYMQQNNVMLFEPTK